MSSITIPVSDTIVRKITVGTPVRRVNPAARPDSIESLSDVYAATKQNGSVLVYDAANERWAATLQLANQDINGGQY